MSFKILFLILPLSLIACGHLEKKECQKSRLQTSAFEHGANGAANKFYRLQKTCKNQKETESLYTAAYNRGLTEFCSFSRGQQQALLGLKQEKACTLSKKYNEGYFSTLEKTCSPQKARIDARKLLNSDNRICLAVDTYKKKYLYFLQKQCSYRKGYALGFQKKGIGQRCKDLQNSKRFLTGHKSGMKAHYQKQNSQIEKKLRTLSNERTQIKTKLKKKNSTEVKQDLNVQLNIVESKILELKHQLEINRQLIN